MRAVFLNAGSSPAMAEAYYAAIAPHCPLGPIALAACLQLDACTPNFMVQELVTLGEGYLKEPFRLENGFIALNRKPGLGIELDEEAVRAQQYDGSWETPRLCTRTARWPTGKPASEEDG